MGDADPHVRWREPPRGRQRARSWPVARPVCVTITTPISTAPQRAEPRACGHSFVLHEDVCFSRDARRSDREFCGSDGARQGFPPTSALRGLDPRHALPNVRHLSEPRAGDATWHNASDVKLRNAHLAVVDHGKVLDYLLNEAHPDNGGKAQFFMSLGFFREDPERLMWALRDVAEHGEVMKSAESVHGEKYVVDGWLSGTLKRATSRRSERFGSSNRGGDVPRLVTAYPGKE